MSTHLAFAPPAWVLAHLDLQGGTGCWAAGPALPKVWVLAAPPQPLGSTCSVGHNGCGRLQDLPGSLSHWGGLETVHLA